jgi:transcriptional regulator of met regulon
VAVAARPVSLPFRSVGALAIPWYEIGMKNVAKVAVSVPTNTLKSLERARRRLRMTRSAVVTEAIERWLAAEQIGEDDKRYVEGYLRQPERSDEVAAIAGSVVRGWEPWE